MAGKKSTMQKEVEKGEQMDLIEVGPENSKEIIRQARIYKALVKKRVNTLADEVAAKTKLLELIKEAKLTRTPGGNIKFHCDGYTITVTPRDELIKVKEDEAAA